jgi:hypothetical protein
MPIRFRCAYCNQLMAIGTRKAGSVVNCTKCHNALVVPVPDNGTGAASAQPGAALANPQTVPANVFEQNDFVNLFEQQAAPHPEALQPPMFSTVQPQAPASPLPAASFIEYDAIPLTPSSRSGRGLHVPPGVLAAACAVIVVLLGLAFFLGLLVGRSG